MARFPQLSEFRLPEIKLPRIPRELPKISWPKLSDLRSLFTREGVQNSLRVQITLLYVLLAMVNISFFSVMVLDNMMDILRENFKLKAKGLESSLVLGDEIKVSQKQDDTFTGLKSNLLALNNIRNFLIFDRDGKIWHKVIDDPENGKRLEEMQEVPTDIRQMTLNLGQQSSLIRKDSETRLNEEDFTVDFLTSVNSTGTDRVFLFTIISVEEIRKGRDQVYFLIVLILIFGIIFHVAFGVYLFYKIFRRVGFLKDASEKMAGGDLSARAAWGTGGADELDDLGSAFNDMAGQVQDKVETISKLNDEMTRELELGKEVQELFLPESNPFKDMLTMYFSPLREVSGDVYKFYNYNKHKNVKRDIRGLFFADASGHGVSAALITTVLLTFLDEITQEEYKPSLVLSRLNQMMTDKLQSSYFATGVFFLFDATGRKCFFSNAGHNPPLVYRPETGKMMELGKDGPPLGMMDDVEYQMHGLSVRPGDRILIFSDGLVEHRNEAGEEFGQDRVENLMKEHQDMKPAEFLPILTKQFEDWVYEYKDDVSILLLEIPE